MKECSGKNRPFEHEHGSALGGILFLLAFGGIWTAVTGGFDFMVARNIYRQKQSEGFPTVMGKVTRSEISSHNDSDGMTYRAEIGFTYEVADQRYEGDEYRYGAMGTSNLAAQRAVTERFPVGKTVPVYYNPEDPQDAVLQTGVSSMDLFLLLFLTPFNIVMIGIWGFAGLGLLRKMNPRPAGGVKIIRRDMDTAVRLPRMGPLSAAGFTALATSFISIFVVGFSTGMNPSMNAVAITWGVVLGLSLLVFIRGTLKIVSGSQDLVIDDRSETLSLPLNHGRKEETLVPYRRIRAIHVEQEESRGKRGRVRHQHAPTIEWERDDGSTSAETLAEWNDAERAQEFVDWLRERLGMEPESTDASEDLRVEEEN